MSDSKSFKGFEKSLPDDPPPAYDFPEVTEDQLETLRFFDTVFLVDDSESMQQYWTQVSGSFFPSPDRIKLLIIDLFWFRCVKR